MADNDRAFALAMRYPLFFVFISRFEHIFFCGIILRMSTTLEANQADLSEEWTDSDEDPSATAAMEAERQAFVSFSL